MYTFEQFVDESQRAQSVFDAIATLEGALISEGYENYIMGTISGRRLADIISFRFPDDFLETYLAEDWQRLDPLLPATERAERPFLWKDVTSKPDLPHEQRAFMAKIKALGVHSGIVFPLHAPQGQCGMVSISRRHHDTQDTARIPHLHAFCVQAWNRCQELAQTTRASDQRAPLSARELEVLKLIKSNQSTDQISATLGISLKTAGFYIASLIEKLGATTRTGAVVQGIKDGLIDL